MTPRAPRAPWGRFPLSELCVAGGLASAVAGLATIGSGKSFWLLAAAMSLGLLGGVELALRERLIRRREGVPLRQPSGHRSGSAR